jgi:HSP20 family molecular chaperone IbpA
VKKSAQEAAPKTSDTAAPEGKRRIEKVPRRVMEHDLLTHMRRGDKGVPHRSVNELKEEKVSKSSAPSVPRACNGKKRTRKADAGSSNRRKGSCQAGLRQWLYATKPVFSRLNHSLAEALDVAEEVRLVLDLADFRPGDIRLEISPDRYLIAAQHDTMQFAEEIPLPKAVDVSTKEEHFKDGILELVLPRRTTGVPDHTGKGDDVRGPHDTDHR